MIERLGHPERRLQHDVALARAAQVEAAHAPQLVAPHLAIDRDVDAAVVRLGRAAERNLARQRTVDVPLIRR
jgi:hypothetical protein